MELDMLKEEILDWIKEAPNGLRFTAIDIYNVIHSCLNVAQASNVLRSLYNDGTLRREEVTEGNKKRFTYWLKEEPKAAPEPENALSRMGGFSPAPSELIKNVKIFDDSNKGKQPEPSKEEVKQIEIPNNFTLELKTPNGFVITIKSSDIK